MKQWKVINSDEISSHRRWDAEFYINPYNDYLKKLFKRWKSWSTLKDASVKLTSGHTPYHHDVSEGDTPFVTVECVSPLALNDEKLKRIWKRHAEGELSRASIAAGDVLITIKRRIGVSVPVFEASGLMAVNQDVVVMTPKPEFRPGFIAAVMNSRIGQFQAHRHSTEQMNPYLNVEALGQLLLPIIDIEVQKNIEKIVADRLALLEQSAKQYREAQQELLDRVGWDELSGRKQELGYVLDFDKIKTAGRFDAEYFQPAYNRLVKTLAKLGAQNIATFCPKPTRGIQPELADGGEVLAIDSKAVRPQGIVAATTERTTREFYKANPKGRVLKNDVLLNSTGRGTIGRAACYQLDFPAICDNHVAILRPDPKVCLPDYLALFLNSPVGFAQTERHQTGSSGQLEIYPAHIEEFLVFLPRNKSGAIDLEWQRKLGNKLSTALSARVTAGERLANATLLVEQAVQ